MSFTVGNRFVVGINNGWFAGQYDHDLGYNQFSGLSPLFEAIIFASITNVAI